MTEISPLPQYDANSSAIWALLIGIDSYLSPSIPTLHGAKNDVIAMWDHLVSQRLVPEDHICRLMDAEATRAAIISAFQEFLIGNTAIRSHDQILIQFCGHGSRRPSLTDTELDGYDETIVPYDSRTPGIFDIPDKTLAALLARLALVRGRNITVLFDCCHSGSGVREFRVSDSRHVRQIEPDARPLPADLDGNIIAMAATRGAHAEKLHDPAAPYVLLAACRDRELANELSVRASDHEEVWYGAFSYFLLQQLGQLPMGATYAELHERVAAHVNAHYPRQMPQCEGDRGRTIFENTRYLRHVVFTLQPDDQGIFRVGGGYVHGLREGTELAVHPPFTHVLSVASSTPIAVLEVIAVSATTARARISSLAAQAIPAHSKCLISNQIHGAGRQRVAMRAHLPAESPDDLTDAPRLVSSQMAVLEDLASMISGSAPGYLPSPLLELVVDSATSADLYVVASREELTICGASGDPLVRPEALHEDQMGQSKLARSQVTALLHALEHIARYRSVISLTNSDPHSGLARAIQVGLRHYRPGVPGAELSPVQAIAGGRIVVTVDPDDEANNLYVVEITNTGAMPYYPHVFTLSPDFSIVRLYPQYYQEEALMPGHTAYLGLNSATERLAFYLPPGWVESQDYLKVIATASPTDLGLLEQGGVRVPPPHRAADRAGFSHTPSSSLDHLLEALLTGKQSRFMRKSGTTLNDDWTTVELAITTLRGDGDHTS